MTSISEIDQTVSYVFSVPSGWLRGKGRTKQLTRARSCAMFLARNLTGMSLTEIGRYFSRDHTTVLHNVKRFRELVSSDGSLADKHGKAASMLKGEGVMFFHMERAGVPVFRTTRVKGR